MTAVFVHGVPETAELWDRVRAELAGVESVALALPGFGVPAPAGFGATMDEYADWLVCELETVGEPVDLVGHDWGGLLTGRVVSTRPELVRSWVSDAMGGFDPDWEWHQFAQIWQTPGDGEEFFAGIRALPLDAQVETFVPMGVPKEDALAMVEANDETMVDCILKLYRSAVDVKRQWGRRSGRCRHPGWCCYRRRTRSTTRGGCDGWPSAPAPASRPSTASATSGPTKRRNKAPRGCASSGPPSSVRRRAP